MMISTAERVIARVVLCENIINVADVEKKVAKICGKFKDCHTCPYYVTADERKEALKVVYEHVTPQELQKEVEK